MLFRSKYRSTSPFYLGQSIACDDNSSYSVDDFGEITKINALGIPESIYQDTVLVLSTDGYFFADKSGTPMFNSVFEEALPFREGLAAVKENEKWGYIDTEGNTVISFEFAKAYSFSGGYAFVENEKGRLAWC